MKKFTRDYFAILLAALWLVWLVIAESWPASYWYEVHRVRVFDGVVGEPVKMVADRSVHRPFTGQWIATVRDIGHGTQHAVCIANGAGSYIPEGKLPPNITLTWWSNGTCNTLPVGTYTLHTSWQFDPGPVWPKKEVVTVSNIFKIEAKK